MTVRDGRIYTLAQSSAGQELVCLSLETGETLWRAKYAFPWELDGLYPGPFAAPTLHGDRVFIADCYGTLQCFSVKNGANLWKFDAARALSPEGVGFGYAATPLVLDGRVLAPAPAGDSATTLFALDAGSGRLIWRSGTNFPSYASCLPIQVQGRPQVVLFLRNGIAGYDPGNGAELWHDSWTRGYDEHATWPLYREPFLFCASPFKRGSRLYRLTMENGQAGAELVWENKLLSNDIFSSVLQDGYVYGFDVQSQQSELNGRTRGSFRCLEFATGRAMWTNQAIAHCSVSAAGRHLLLLDDSGRLALVDPSPEGYRELASAELPKRGKYWIAPVVAGSRLLVRSRETIACYSLAGPAVPGSFAPVKVATSFEPVVDWIQKHRSRAFVAPTARALFEWYAGGLAVLAAAGLVTIFAGKERRLPTMIAASLALGVAGTYLLTVWQGKMVFALPVTLCAAFCGLMIYGLSPRSRPWQGWLLLLGFIGACAGYYYFCARYFLLAGWGFLTGFPFALGPGLWLARRLGGGRSGGREAILAWVTFTAFYWGAALVILLRTA